MHCIFNVLGVLWILLSAGGMFAAENPNQVGWIKLLANPKEFDGKLIELSGWLTVHTGQESAVFHLFMTNEAMSYGDVTQGLLIESKSMESRLPDPREVWQQFNHERVRIVGIFRLLELKQYPPGYAGKIEKIQFVQQEKPGSPLFVPK
jgi:hypothetical protein